jgi:hypothetical protein
MSPKPSRPVTRRRCVICREHFTARRRDARYCSGKCRQRANRARQVSDDLDREIEVARRYYWALVRLAAESRGVGMSQILTEQSQTVDAQGNVFMGGRMGGMGPGARLVGHTTPARPGWTAWGLEAAGPPFSPPPFEAPKDEPERAQRSAAIRQRAAARRQRGGT